ncbi:MAG TPA: tetratricopeptide repeat protein [Roseateles sp.]|nr:tetratricopeptide repeat protein [Roseateles sp.]
MQTSSPLALVRCLLLGLALLGSGLAQAQDLETAQAQWLQGKRQQALDTVQQALAKSPNDAKLRFARAVMQMDLGRTAEAEAGLQALTQDFPDLADPYNNLAVLHAARGELDQARAALEQALRLQPDHLQAQENLGDVLLRLASRAYGLALRQGHGDTSTLQRKLEQLQTLIKEPTGAQR